MPLAHAGHWLVQVVFFAPVLVFGLWMAWFLVRERRAGARDGEPPPDGDA